MDKFRGSNQVTKMTESDIELMAIEQLEGMGYTNRGIVTGKQIGRAHV